MNQPLISVIIPAYNEEGVIERAIRCIQNQTYRNLEIIVVDDYSTDTTPDIIKRIAREDPRISYHQTPRAPRTRKNWRGYNTNAGYAARAYGFEIAKGGWITTQDADDSSLLNRIEVQYELAQKYNATLVTVHWQQALPEVEGKRLDVERLFREVGEDILVIRPETIAKVVDENTGIFTRMPFFHIIPFPIKWFPYTRFLFYGKLSGYPGADNSMLFRREVIAAGINFRPRNHRAWGVPSGRGTGRDFVFHTAATFKNSWSFNLPLYLWDVRTPHPTIPTYNQYLLS